MTRAEILEKCPTMTARERDALVAEARGWRELRTQGREGLLGIPPGQFTSMAVPAFRLWAHAGPLLEELATLPGVCWVELDAPGDLIEQWAVELHDDDEDDLLGCPFGETACDAVALTFVLAKVGE